jgi:hypothetical protein
MVSFNVAPQVGVIQDASLYGGQSRRALYQGALSYRGTFVVRLNYEGLEELLRGVFGAYARSVVSGVIADHTFKEGATLNSYTFEVGAGDVPAGKVFRLLGAKLTGVTIRGTAGTGTDAMLQAEFTVIARDMQSDQTPTASTSPATVTTCLATSSSTLTRAAFDFAGAGVAVGQTVSHPSFPVGTTVAAVAVGTVTLSAPANGSLVTATAVFSTLQAPSLLPVLYHQAITADDGTADAASSVRIRSFEVTLENPHAEDRFYLGSLNIDEPIRQDFLTARWRLTQEFTTKAQFDAARAFTQGSPQFLFRHATDLGGTNFREFELRSNKANLVEFSAPIEGYGIILSTATWEAFYDDATDLSALVARTRNCMVALP